MVAVTGLLPAFIAVNEAILPSPLAARPIPGVSFAHLYPAPVPVKLIAGDGKSFATV